MRFDEVYGPEGVRPHYRQLMDRLESLGDDDLADGFGLLDSFCQTLGMAVNRHGLSRIHASSKAPAYEQDATAGVIGTGIGWREMEEPVKPDAVQPVPAQVEEESPVSQPTKLIRIASMTRAMLEEVRQAPLDESGRKRLAEVHERSLDELREVLSEDLLEEFNEVMVPLDEAVTEADIRIAQAQLIGWLEGLFHGIQASLWSQQMAAQAQLAEMQKRSLLPPGEAGPADGSAGPYL